MWKSEDRLKGGGRGLGWAWVGKGICAMLELSGENSPHTPVPASIKHHKYGLCQQIGLGEGPVDPLRTFLALAG